MYTVRTKQLTDEEIREYHRKRLYELSLKTIGAVPWLDEPTDDQKQWFIHRMKGSRRNWKRWFVGQYFTEEQKKQLGLTDEDIAGRGMA